MGPICDGSGVEQGGVLSSESYQLVGDEELKCSSASGLGISIGSTILSSIGSADDVVLLSSNPINLQSLLDLSLEHCK